MGSRRSLGCEPSVRGIPLQQPHRVAALAFCESPRSFLKGNSFGLILLREGQRFVRIKPAFPFLVFLTQLLTGRKTLPWRCMKPMEWAQRCTSDRGLWAALELGSRKEVTQLWDVRKDGAPSVTSYSQFRCFLDLTSVLSFLPCYFLYFNFKKRRAGPNNLTQVLCPHTLNILPATGDSFCFWCQRLWAMSRKSQWTVPFWILLLLTCHCFPIPLSILLPFMRPKLERQQGLLRNIFL